MVDGGADLHPLGSARRLGETAGLGARQRAKFGMTFLDSTNIRAHQKAAGAPRKGGSAKERDGREALGCSCGFGTKACVIADGAGRTIGFRIAPGQAHELPHAVPLLDRLRTCLSPAGAMVLQCIPHLTQIDLRPFFEGLQYRSCLLLDTMRVPISAHRLRGGRPPPNSERASESRSPCRHQTAPLPVDTSHPPR